MATADPTMTDFFSDPGRPLSERRQDGTDSEVFFQEPVCVGSGQWRQGKSRRPYLGLGFWSIFLSIDLVLHQNHHLFLNVAGN
jgi:hypothetical protein